MNTYFSIPEPLFVLQISQLPKVAQNWFCIQNLHMELSFQKKKTVLKSIHWFRRYQTNKHLNVFFETPCRKFMHQLPRSSANVSACIDGGFKPVWAHIAERTLLYASSLMWKSPDFWPRIILSENLSMGAKSPYTRHLLQWKSVTKASLL